MTNFNEKIETNGLKNYNYFLFREYDNIASAHFNTVNSISTFFRYYLLIVSIPIPLIAIVIKPSPDFDILTFLNNVRPYLSWVAIIISITGLFVMCFISNLRFDAILYARTINGIRRYFSNNSGLEFDVEYKYRTLPVSKFQPRYFEFHYFFWVILAFSFLDSIYFSAAIWGLFSVYKDSNSLISAISGFFIFTVHIAVYYQLSRYRETHYLKKLKIGVDLDGVLNKHRNHFCEILNKLTGKRLDPKTITKIPVHKIENTNVTESDEHCVFNSIDYWKNMPPDEEAANVLNKIEKNFSYKVKIFTYRPWPLKKTFPETKLSEYEKCWNNEIKQWWKNWVIVKHVIKNFNLKILKEIPIIVLTTEWLKRNGFPYKNIVIERGNEYSHEIVSSVKNRFVISQLEEIKIFVEDDLYKAIKLASICELVFLIDHPYNFTSNLPYNIIRVKSWSEIYQYFRKAL